MVFLCETIDAAIKLTGDLRGQVEQAGVREFKWFSGQLASSWSNESQIDWRAETDTIG